MVEHVEASNDSIQTMKVSVHCEKADVCDKVRDESFVEQPPEDGSSERLDGENMKAEGSDRKDVKRNVGKRLRSPLIARPSILVDEIVEGSTKEVEKREEIESLEAGEDKERIKRTKINMIESVDDGEDEMRRDGLDNVAVQESRVVNGDAESSRGNGDG